MYKVKCYVCNVVCVYCVDSVSYNNGKIVMGVSEDNEVYLVVVCPDFDEYESIINSLYADGKVSIGEKYNFDWF